MEHFSMLAEKMAKKWNQKQKTTKKSAEKTRENTSLKEKACGLCNESNRPREAWSSTKVCRENQVPCQVCQQRLRPLDLIEK